MVLSSEATRATTGDREGAFTVAQGKNPPAMQEAWVRSPGQEDPLEKKMTTHWSMLAWEILWTEEAGSLLSMGSQ